MPTLKRPHPVIATIAALMPIALASVPLTIRAAPYCSDGNGDGALRVKQAVNQWEQLNSTGVAQPVKDAATKEFCQAASSVIKDRVADAPTVDRISKDVVVDFLDRQSGMAGTPRTMSASMREELGIAGLSRPQIRRFALVRFTYTKPVDALMVDEDHYPKQNKMLLPVGKHLIKALQGASVQCSQTLEATAGVDSAFGC